jgi:hypothetical protein
MPTAHTQKRDFLKDSALSAVQNPMVRKLKVFFRMVLAAQKFKEETVYIYNMGVGLDSNPRLILMHHLQIFQRCHREPTETP